MKTLRYTLSLALLLITALSCTHNNGDIGNQFGQWKLVTMTRAGVDDADYKGNIFWSFQNTTIEIKEVAANHEVWQTFGNYRLEDATLFLSFPDEDRPPRPVLGLPRECELQVVRLKGGEMVLYYPENETTYTFRRW